MRPPPGRYTIALRARSKGRISTDHMKVDRVALQKPNAVLISGTCAKLDIAAQFTMTAPTAHTTAAPKNTSRPGRVGG